MTLEEAVETACRDLPEGYLIGLYMENGNAYVQLIDKTGREVISDEIDGWLNLSEAIETATDIARRMQ
jgi:hypothetical protein